jgi:DMSO/TMAO reductase YedYZ molybdopterin-dependent catalytic subunit
MKYRILILMMVLAVSAALVLPSCGLPTPFSPTVPGEVEATEYQGMKLTPISQQQNNALKGTQHIEKDSYKLTVGGLVDKPLSLSYADLLAYPQISKLMDLNCVEGWKFTAKWTGPSLNAILADAKVKPGATIVIFHTSENLDYSSLDLFYVRDRNIILGMKLNDVTLPTERGFPFQVVAESKYGYKWSKWVTSIELSSDTNFKGYWESAGYNNNADISGPAFEEPGR